MRCVQSENKETMMIKKIFCKSGVVSVVVLFTVSLTFASYAQAKTVLRFFNWQLTEEVNLQALQKMKEIYEKKHPDVEIKLEEVSHKDKNVKFVVASQGGNPPDVCKFEIQDIISHIRKGYLLNLDPFIEQEGKAFLDNYAETSKRVARYQGHMYAMCDTCETIVLAYNAEMWKKAGLDPDRPPTTFGEFLEYAKQLVADRDGDGRDDQWGFAFPADRSGAFVMRFSPIFWSFGGRYMNEALDASMLNTPDSLAGFKYFVELYTKHGVVPPGPTEMGAHDIRIMMAQEKIGMMGGGSWTLSEVSFMNPKAQNYLRDAPWPVERERVTFASLCFWAISSQTKHPQEAWEFTKFLAGEEAQTLAFEANGVISANLAVANSPVVKADPYARVVAELVPYGRTLPQYIGWDEIYDAVLTAEQEALTELKTPEQALLDAHEAVNQIIERYKGAE